MCISKLGTNAANVETRNINPGRAGLEITPRVRSLFFFVWIFKFWVALVDIRDSAAAQKDDRREAASAGIKEMLDMECGCDERRRQVLRTPLGSNSGWRDSMATPSNGWSSLSPSPHDPPAPFLVKASLRASPGVMPQHSQGLKTQYSLASLPTDPTSSLEAPNVASPSLKRRKSPGRKASSVKSQVSSPKSFDPSLKLPAFTPSLSHDVSATRMHRPGRALPTWLFFLPTSLAYPMIM
ncbi:hypothetical protein FB451DRAFT_1375887 [Mycena latifolia]|nr:hypothetical protein FB451DRAFT_1375887 [Mycena latifolia]